MSAVPIKAGLAVGDVIAEHDYHLTRDTLVRYAGASGDFNPIHYRDDVAPALVDLVRPIQRGGRIVLADDLDYSRHE